MFAIVGMQPVMYSTLEAQEDRVGWVRVGTNVCYYRNYFTRSREVTGGPTGKTYYTSTFTVTFPHTNDTCYFAYHYPYTFTMLQVGLPMLRCHLSVSRFVQCLEFLKKFGNLSVSFP